MSDAVNDALRKRSGSVKINRDRLTSFLYSLMIEHITCGRVEGLVRASPADDTSYSNGWLARYAKDLADRLREGDKYPDSEIAKPAEQYRSMF